MAEADNYVWCTSGCGSGQIHIEGTDQPIVACLHCGHQSCFHHRIQWHQNLTCEEYDQFRADPENFRFRIELDHDEWEAQRRALEGADLAMAQGLLADEVQARQRAERELRERDAARKAIAMERVILARRKKEEEQTMQTVSQTTKPCPGCGWAIEKNDGWCVSPN